MGRRVVHVPATGWEYDYLRRQTERLFLAKDRRMFGQRFSERRSEREVGAHYGWLPALRIGRAIRLWGRR